MLLAPQASRDDGRNEEEAPPYAAPCPERPARDYIYQMEEYMRECVERYCSLRGISKDRLRRNVATPFIDEAKDPSYWVVEEVGEPAERLAIKKRKMAAQASATAKELPQRL